MSGAARRDELQRRTDIEHNLVALRDALAAGAVSDEILRATAARSEPTVALEVAFDQLSFRYDELAQAEEELTAQLDEAEQLVRAANDARSRYQTLFDLCPDGMIVTDLRGVIRESNAAAGALVEVAPAYLEGKTIEAFVRERDAKGMLDVLVGADADGRVGAERAPFVEIETVLRNAEDREVPATLRAAIQPDANRVFWTIRVPLGEMPIATATISRMRFERLVAERTAQLEHAVNELSSQLAEARLLGEARAREKATSDRSLALASHELRQPLQTILGWTSILRQSGDAVTRERAVDVIEQSALAQAELVDNLFHQARLVAGKPLARDRVDLASLVNGLVEALQTHADAAGVELAADVPEQAWVAGDASALRQIVTNLVSNAIRHSNRAGRVVAEVAVLDEAVHLLVCDEGDGIAPEDLERVFERFEQGTRSDSGGLGLGLFVVRSLVEQLGGTVEAISEGPGTGTCFVVSLPLFRCS